jgi:bifunctional DNA-binding transcriptional regulator/antitoxin component of YhaV-PrlF toxin-antitoxin module
LPPDLLAQLGWDVGDILIAEVFEDGIRFVRAQTDHERTIEIGAGLMDEYRKTFEKLAKN